MKMGQANKFKYFLTNNALIEFYKSSALSIYHCLLLSGSSLRTVCHQLFSNIHARILSPFNLLLVGTTKSTPPEKTLSQGALEAGTAR
jgi:hypothetical protein